jgi:hypothetical protein
MMSPDVLALSVVFLNAVLLMLGFGSILCLILFLSRDTTKIPELLARVSNIEELVEQLAAEVSAEIGEPLREFWKTSDGKYTATSFEELLSNMASDPNGPLSQEELDAIRSIFDKIAGESSDSDEDDEDVEPWKRKRK